MKFSIIALAFVSILNANEMARIDAIIEDISKLRDSYSNCKSELESKKSQGTAALNTQKDSSSLCQAKESELKEYKELLKKEQSKNSLLTEKIESKTKSTLNSGKENQIISELERMLDDQNKALKLKEGEINSLKKELIEKIKAKDNQIISLKSSKTKTVAVTTAAPIIEENNFPKLKMKEDEAPKNLSQEYEIPKNLSSEAIYPSIASFRLTVDCEVYDSAGGTKVMATWIKGRSFTSNQRTKNWIKVTGYFVDKVWQKATEELWIEAANVAVK
ncbi:MAG: hypothetical protein NTW78_10495 [Campylobacterales bacterium]|nr:hypothetical protein [Campylobacterales bacterium]